MWLASFQFASCYMIRYRLVFDTLMIDWVGLNLQVHFILDLFGYKTYDIHERFMSISKCCNWSRILKFLSNIESLFSFDFELKKLLPKFCILGPLRVNNVPQLKRYQSDLYNSIRLDMFFSWKLIENKDSKFDDSFNIRRKFQHFEYDMICELIVHFIFIVDSRCMTSW